MKEENIRPKALLDQFLELSKKDADRLFSGTAKNAIPCVACGSENRVIEFEKNGFSYAKCLDCGSLYHSPRGSADQFASFYRHSESWRYWSEVYFPAVAEVRRESIFRPRVKLLSELCLNKGIRVDSLIEVGAGYGIFLEEWKRINASKKMIAIEPSPALAQKCRSKGFEVAEDIAENVRGYDGVADLVVCFEVLEHVYEPLAFLKVLARFAKPGGYVLVSTLGIDGFDLQVLGRESQSIFPPHHINFPSVSGFEKLFHRAGFSEVAVTTPGRLDVDIVRNAAHLNPAVLDGQVFLRRLIENDRLGMAFQQFLVDNLLSSHTWVLGRKAAV